MVVIKELGGVRVYGNNAEDWLKEDQRQIQGCFVEFNSSTSSPDVDTGSFLFPAYRGQMDYQIHLLETGSVLVIKDERVYFCMKIEGLPEVIAFTAMPLDQKLANSSVMTLISSNYFLNPQGDTQ